MVWSATVAKTVETRDRETPFDSSPQPLTIRSVIIIILSSWEDSGRPSGEGDGVFSEDAGGRGSWAVRSGSLLAQRGKWSGGSPRSHPVEKVTSHGHRCFLRPASPSTEAASSGRDDSPQLPKIPFSDSQPASGNARVVTRSGGTLNDLFAPRSDYKIKHPYIVSQVFRNRRLEPSWCNFRCLDDKNHLFNR